MRERGYGRIVVISSSARRGRAPGPGRLRGLEGRPARHDRRRSPPRTSAAGSPPTPSCPGWSRPRRSRAMPREILRRCSSRPAPRGAWRAGGGRVAGRLPGLRGRRLRHRPGDRRRRRRLADAMILPCDGKRPIHDGWPHRTYTAGDVVAELRRVANPMIGLRFGPGSYIDIKADSPDKEAPLQDCLRAARTNQPTFASTRGKHRLFRWDDRLAETGAAIVSYRGTNGAASSAFASAAGDKGAQSIIPPSPGRTWLVGWG